MVQFVRNARAAQTLARSPHVSASTRRRADRAHERIVRQARLHAESLVASGHMRVGSAQGWLRMVAWPPPVA